VVTLKTGDNRRDRDLNKSMESDRYPTLRFDLAGIVPDDPRSDPSAEGADLGVTLKGTLTIHGVRRDVAIPARLRFEASAIHVKADFPLNLKDYRIGGLSKMLGLLKMDEHIVVHVDLRFDS
jgi:polyisoprenoid-binding protein YceI